MLELKESANVNGEVTYGKLKIDSGAVLTGQLRMVGTETRALPSGAKVKSN